MRKLILVLGTCLVGFGLFAADMAPMVEVAQIASKYTSIITMHVKLGEKVKKGQLIFELNNKWGTSKAKAENAVKYRKQIYDRNQKLLKTNNVSLQDFQTSEYNYKNAVSDLKLVLINIKDCYYYAPFDGKVTKINNYTGSSVNGGGDEVVGITRDFNDRGY